MKYLKIFIAGLAFPSVLLPVILLFVLMFDQPQVLTVPFLHFIPLAWGIWNILYFAFFKKVLPGSANIRLLLTGGILGLLIAIYGVFWLNLPSVIGMPKSVTYLPLILAPILYAIFWLFIVGPLNHLLGLRDE